ncbi:MAG: hypothetical protein HY210_04500 [Candidatus Omnitrophica bacterium]|nr:hypothetical protein [Candidatus Omnitrophota bacterium]
MNNRLDGGVGMTYATQLDVGNVTGYTATGLTSGTTYYFVVSAKDASGESPNSNERSAMPVAAPVLNTATAGDKQVTLAWTAATGAAGYKIYYGTAPGVYGTPITVGNVTTSTVTGLTNGTTYYFAVSGTNTSGESARSNERSAAPVPPAPAAPVLSTATAGDKQVTLDWAAATGAAGYKIYYGTAPGVYGGTPITVGNITTSTVTGLTNGTTYYFAVSATNTGGESLRSNEMSAIPVLPPESATLFVKNVDYNASGQMTKVEYGNGDVTTYTYNSLNLRLTRLYTVNSLAQPVQDLNYTYDSAGNILSIADNVNTSDQTFKYDELNRLVEAVNPNPGSYGTKTYTYDAIGNIAAKDGKTYFYGGTSGGPHAVTALSDGTAFSYDANGNMVGKTEGGGASAVTTAYTYDAENRLTKVVKNGSTIGQYEYDGDGGRVKKTATVSGTTTATTFVGSLFETSGARSTKFIFLGGQRVAAVTNSPAIGSTTLYYHADHLGGANVLTDATGFKKELIEYEPFGQESRHEKYGSSEEIAWYYFTGKKTDDESGLIYFGARYYDPKLGRFISPDTIVPYPSDPQSFNRYSYARNNPVNVIDPTGHKWSWKKFWHAAVGAIVGVVAAMILGPAGLYLVGSTMAGIIGGAVGGAITGGLDGGWKGALMGAAFGGALGGVGGWAVGGGHSLVLGGMFLAGTGVAAATDSWDGFAGGLTGGLAGAAVGKGFVRSQQFQNFKAGDGFVSNRDLKAAKWEEYIATQRALNVKKNDMVKVDIPARYLTEPDAEMSGTMANFRHRAIRGNGIGFDMGPDSPIRGQITIGTPASPTRSYVTTDAYIQGFPGAYRSATVEVSYSGLVDVITAYQNTWTGQPYNPFSYNSNYAVDTIIYGAGGRVPENLGWTYQGR